MDNSMDALSSLLSDPAALSAAMEMAKGLFAGAGQTTPQNPAPANGTEAASAAARPKENHAPSPGPSAGADDDKTRLLLALRPFLSPKRSEKVGTVIALMRAMQMMGTILPGEGGK